MASGVCTCTAMKGNEALNCFRYDSTSCRCMHGYTCCRLHMMSASAWSQIMVPVKPRNMDGEKKETEGGGGGRGRQISTKSAVFGVARSGK